MLNDEKTPCAFISANSIVGSLVLVWKSESDLKNMQNAHTYEILDAYKFI